MASAAGSLVYVVEGGYSCEGYDVIHASCSKEVAIAHAKEACSRRWDYIRISKWTDGKCTWQSTYSDKRGWYPEVP